MDTAVQKKPSFEGLDAIFIDLDHTLFNTQKQKFEFMKQFAEREGSGWSRERQSVFSARQRELFHLWHIGDLNAQEFLLARGKAFCEVFSIAKTPKEGMEMINYSIRNSLELLPGAAEAMERLSRLGLPIYLASTGIYVNQSDRLADTGLLRYFSDLFVSDRVDCPKSNPNFYHSILRMTGIAPERAIMIGDTVTDDIVVAKFVGMQTCWIMGTPNKEIPPEADYYVLGPGDLI